MDLILHTISTSPVHSIRVDQGLIATRPIAPPHFLVGAFGLRGGGDWELGPEKPVVLFLSFSSLS